MMTKTLAALILSVAALTARAFDFPTMSQPETNGKPAVAIVVPDTAEYPQKFVGTWKEVVDGKIDPTSGYKFFPQGLAVTTGMYDLIVTGWYLDKGKLTLTGQLLADGETVNHWETYDVKTADGKKLVIEREGVVRTFEKPSGK